MPIMWFCHDDLHLAFDTINSYIELQIESERGLALSLSLCVFMLALPSYWMTWRARDAKFQWTQNMANFQFTYACWTNGPWRCFSINDQNDIESTPQILLVLLLLLLPQPGFSNRMYINYYFINYANGTDHGKLTLAKFYFCMVDVISRRRIFFPFVRSLARSFIVLIFFFIHVQLSRFDQMKCVAMQKPNYSHTKNALQTQASRAAAAAAVNHFLWVLLLQIGRSHNPVGCNSVGQITRAQCHNTHFDAGFIRQS